MNHVKKILLAILIVLIVIQFIQPARNKSGQVLATDMAAMYKMPDTVQAVLKAACYDCHSNNTNYPWYTYVQPVGWMLANHIRNGKEELNFNEFGSYTLRRQKSKLKSIANQVKDGDMPLYSYTIMHKNARLIKEQKQLVIEWAQKTKDSLEQNNP
jgi:hypothetical protein